MSSNQPGDELEQRTAAQFATTHWSTVLAAGNAASPQSAEALERLCRTYWYPLYAFVRRRGHGPHDTEDLLQGFFARFLEKRDLANVGQTRGRFRSFLLAALKHYLANEWDKARAVKRGGRFEFLPLESETAEGWYGEEPTSELTPEKLYEQRWASVLLEQVMERLQHDFDASAEHQLFDALKSSLLGETQSATYAELAAQHGLSEGALKMRVRRLRQRYQRLLREEIAHTVAGPEEVEDELRHLFSVVSG